MTSWEWRKSADEQRWTLYLNGVRTTGMDVTEDREGMFVAFGDRFKTLVEAQHFIECWFELAEMTRVKPVTVSVVFSPGHGKVVHVASTTQKAAEWALNNDYTAAKITEWEVDGELRT